MLLSKFYDVSINTLLGAPRQLVCQCCGMPLEDATTSHEPDGAFNEDYCKWCYTDGAFKYTSMEELIDFCASHMASEAWPEAQVRAQTAALLAVYALIMPVKVLNMILGSGVLRSGGRTELVMVIDIAGTWGFGVPLGLLGAFVLRLPVTAVYAMLSLEEGVRLAIGLAVFRRGSWMRRLGGEDSPRGA